MAIGFLRPPKFLRRFVASIRPTEEPKASSELDQAKAADERLVFSLAKVRVPSLAQLRYLKEFLSSREKRTILLLLGIAVAASVVLVVRFFDRHLQAAARPGGEYVEAIVGQPRFINPVLAAGSGPDVDLVRLVFSGLTKLSPDGTSVPDLAERLDLSEDKKVYTVTLRPNLRWHDGEDLTIDDVVFTYETVRDPSYLSPLASLYRNVTVEKVDDRTIRFTLKDPSTTFPALLTLGIIPQHLFIDVQPANFALTEYNLRPVGSGPFTFSSLTKNNRTGEVRTYELTRNPAYHGQSPYLEKMTFRLYPTEEEAFLAFEDGKVLGVSGVSAEKAAGLKPRGNVDLQRLPLAETVAVFLSSRHPPFKSKEVRRALADATDRNRIIREGAHGFGQLIDAPALPGLAGVREDLRHPTFNPQAANEQLEAAGWKRGDDGVRRKGDEELKVTLTTADEPDYDRIATILKENWEAVGVKVEIQKVDPVRIQKDIIRPRSYQAILFAEVLGQSRDAFPFWHSTQIADPGLNLPIFISKEGDTLLEEARRVPSPERQAKYTALQKLLAEEQPAIFLYQADYLYPATEKLRGVTKDLMVVQSADRFVGVESWYIKTKLKWNSER